MNPSVTGKQNNDMIVVQKTRYDFNITSVVGVLRRVILIGQINALCRPKTIRSSDAYQAEAILIGQKCI